MSREFIQRAAQLRAAIKFSFILPSVGTVDALKRCWQEFKLGFRWKVSQYLSNKTNRNCLCPLIIVIPLLEFYPADSLSELCN